MALTLAQLLSPLSKDAWKQRLLDSLHGRGIVTSENATTAGKVPKGTGSVALSGTPSTSAQLRLKIVTSGEPGAAEFQYSTDAGATYSSTVTMPANGIYAVPGTGVTATFTAGPVGAGTSFVVGDVHSAELYAPGFPTTSWDAFSVPRALLETDAQALEEADKLIAAIAAGGFIRLATGSWQDLNGENVYDEPRTAAVTTRGLATLTAVASAGPYTIVAGQLVISTGGGLRYRNVGGGTLSAGGTLQLTWEAESPGAAYNVGNGAITTMVTTLPGVSVANPDPGSGTWVTTQGADEESEAAYAARCIAKWPALGGGTTASTYDLWAKTAAPAVTRTRVVTNSSAPGQVDIYCAGSSGPSPAPDVAAVQAYVEARAPLTAVPVAQAAITNAVTVTATVNYRTAETTLGAVQAAAASALTALFNSFDLGNSVTGEVTLYLSDIIATLDNVAGVRNVTVSSPAADVQLALGEVLVLTQNLTFTGV